MDIRLKYLPLETVLEVRDDGVGMPEAKIPPMLANPTNGIGIASMKARISDLGGVLSLVAQPKGPLIRAVMPRRRASDVLKAPDGATAAERAADT